ncbi:hypothetical protein PLCT1_00196 [Planctomycetaceae bacterium]|nr:hypothetical protein PLCT1_00196 [Planctomycetaceae bacterium]
MRPALVLMSLCFALMGCVEAPAMTDEEVKAAWEKEHDTTIDSDDFGIKRSETFKNVISCGTFAHDYGMRDSGMFVGATFTDSVNGCQTVLENAGWKDAKVDAREKLAKAYVCEVLCAWRGYMATADDNFKSQDKFKFSEMEAKTVEGKTVITFWQAGVVGMRPERDYYKIEVTIGEDGKMGERKTLEQFEVSLR